MGSMNRTSKFNRIGVCMKLEVLMTYKMLMFHIWIFITVSTFSVHCCLMLLIDNMFISSSNLHAAALDIFIARKPRQIQVLSITLSSHFINKSWHVVCGNLKLIQEQVFSYLVLSLSLVPYHTYWKQCVILGDQLQSSPKSKTKMGSSR